MIRSSLRQHWPSLFVIAAPMILYAPFLVGAEMFYWGTPLMQFYPWRFFALETIRAGYLPLWNPHVGMGAPLIANYQSALFYPPNWLSLIMPLDLSLNWLLVLHLIGAGVGMVTLARHLGFQPLGQAVAGLAFGLSQHLVGHSVFYSMNAALPWMPWVIWAGDKLATSHPQLPTPKSGHQLSVTKEPSKSKFSVTLSEAKGLPLGQEMLRFAHAHSRDKSGSYFWTSPNYQFLAGILRLSFIVALQLLSGHAQTTWYTLMLLGAWMLWRIVTSPPALSPRHLVTLSCLASALVLAALLAALQLLPTVELLRQSQRADAADYDFVMTFSFSPWRLLTLLAPDLLGNPARGQFYGYATYWEDAIYIGVLPFLLSLGLLLRSIARLKSPTHPLTHSPNFILFLILILPVALLLALGRNTPVFPFLYRYVPTFSLFQAPARMMIWFVFALSLLGGLGADRWTRPQGRALYWTRLGAAGAASIIVTGAAALAVIAPSTPVGQQLLMVARAVLVAGVGLFAAALLSLLKPEGDSARWQWAVAIVLAADLIYANSGLNPGAPPDLYRAPTHSGPVLAQALDGRRLFQFPDDEYQVKYGSFISFRAFGGPELARAARETQLANMNLLDGLASASLFDPLISSRYLDFIDVVSQTHSLKLLQFMNVGAVISRAPLEWDAIAANEHVTFYRVPGADQARRYQVVYSARTVPAAAAARVALADPAFDPRREVILEADDPGRVSGGSAPRACADPNPNCVAFQVTLDRAGWVVLADAYYPGWSASVAGKPALIQHANYAFRAVAVDAGEHTVVFYYEPLSLQLGLALSAMAGALWIVLAGLTVWHARR